LQTETAPDAPKARPVSDLVDRDFRPWGWDTPDKIGSANITYVPTASGFLAPPVVPDVFRRRIVGWAMARHLRTELLLPALGRTVAQRRPGGTTHHSDQGSRYTPIAFRQCCEKAAVQPPMGSIEDFYDNAMCKSFFATLEW
jgi:putative transposase